MADIQDLINALGDGKANALHASELERILKMEVGHTQESTRALIRDAVINSEFPIGSTNAGYFLIDNEQEYKKTIANLRGRVKRLRDRIGAIDCGWKRREKSRSKGENWPK